MSIQSQAVKPADSGNGAKAADRICGPPWSPKVMAPATVSTRNKVDDALSKFKAASDSTHLSDSRADYLAMTIALQQGSGPANSNEQGTVGNASLAKVVGPPWSPKEYKPAPKSETGAATGLYDGYVPKKG